MATRKGSIEAAFIEAWNSHDIERVVGLYAGDYEGIDTGSPATDHGLDDLQRTARRYFRAFPDLRMNAEEVVAHGNRVAISWTATGTHQGKLMSIPPSGRLVTVRGVSVLTLKDGKITRGVHVWDVAGLLRAIRLLPDLTA